MIPEVFFCTAPQSQERFLLALQRLQQWRNAGISPIVLQANPRESFEFQSRRRMIAEQQASTPVYIVADDDMFPSRTEDVKQWLEDGVSLMADNFKFGMLSPLLEDTNLGSGSTADGLEPFVSEDVMECHNVGGIRFIAKGIVKEWPKQDRRGYDQEHCAAMQKEGYKVGYMKNLYAIHPGHQSETWKEVTDWKCPRIL